MWSEGACYRFSGVREICIGAQKRTEFVLVRLCSDLCGDHPFPSLWGCVLEERNTT